MEEGIKEEKYCAAPHTEKQKNEMHNSGSYTGQQEKGGSEPRLEQGADSGSGRAGGMLAGILETFPGKQQDIRTYSPLTLAYIGDAVYDLIIRTVVVERANRPANELHHTTVKYVSANAQSRIVQALMEKLTGEEQAIYRRGKNSKPHTTAKNASVTDYLRATGFEAVIGYLYLTNRMDRVLELVRLGLELAGMKI